MEGGWMAGGYIAKLAVKRLRSQWSTPGETSRKLSPQEARELAKELNEIDPHLPVETLLNIRINLVKRGLLE